MYSKKELTDKLTLFLENKKAAKSTKKDYKVDCMSFIRWYLKNKETKDCQLYSLFLNALNNSKLSQKTKTRRRIIVGEYLVYIGALSSSHLIVIDENNMIKYFDINNCQIILKGKKYTF